MGKLLLGWSDIGVALIEMAKVIIFLVLGYSSHVTPLVFSFSNQNEPNLAQTFRMIRIGSVRDCFSVTPAVMSYLRGQVRWRASMAAVFLSFSLETKGPKIQGRHHGPTALSNRPSPMSAGPAHPTRSVFGIPTHGIKAGNSTAMDNTRTPCRHRGRRPAIS